MKVEGRDIHISMEPEQIATLLGISLFCMTKSNERKDNRIQSSKLFAIVCYSDRNFIKLESGPLGLRFIVT